MKKFLKKHWTTILLTAILLAGLCLLLYPSVSDWWNSMHQSRAVASYVEDVEDMSAEIKEEMLEAADAYNQKLAGQGIHFDLSPEEKAEYQKLLDFSDTGVMGYIQIPQIDVNLPIYHGTDEAVLQVAVGHLEGTSLPVGGESSHASISGHRGLPSARLFTDLDKMVEGDIFTVTVLDRTVTYMVDQIRIVLPEETSELAIHKGEDYLTLITCTPYGVNSHRMLVRGRRIENIEEMPQIEPEAKKIPAYVVFPVIGIPLLFVTLAVMLLYYSRRRPAVPDDDLLDELKK